MATRTRLTRDFSGDSLARIERVLQRARERHEFWARYVELPDFNIDVEEVISSWVGARDGLSQVLDGKLGTPLESIELDSDVEAALARYETVAAGVRTLSAALLELAEFVAAAKEKAKHGSLPTAQAELTSLEATSRRHDEVTAALCEGYLLAKTEKVALEEEKKKARQALKEHRDKVFGTYQVAINGLLVKFNADFRIEREVWNRAKR